MTPSSKPIVQMKNARIVRNDDRLQLQGIVTNHPYIPDGELVNTSIIVKITVETKNTIYNVELQ